MIGKLGGDYFVGQGAEKERLKAENGGAVWEAGA
jgi:hypothetical protein